MKNQPGRPVASQVRLGLKSMGLALVPGLWAATKLGFPLLEQGELLTVLMLYSPKVSRGFGPNSYLLCLWSSADP